MFNGIIEVIGTILRIDDASIQLDAGRFASSLKKGDSVAVDGVCLTVARKKSKSISFDLAAETVSRTNFRQRSKGDRVNLELPVTGSTMISGHFVQGHVEGVGKTVQWKRDGNDVRLRIRIPRDLTLYCVPKGSIALNGVSLTIAALKGQILEVALIPYTLEHTNLALLKAGDEVNIETDVLGRYVVSFLKSAYDRKRIRRP